MFSSVLVTGMVTNIYEPETEGGESYITLKSLRTINSNAGQKTTWADVILKMLPGYEKYSGKINVGDQLLCRGRLAVDTNGGPVFSENTGLPLFILTPTDTKNLGPITEQTGNDIFMVTAVGNLGRDPMMRILSNGETAVTDVSIATSHKYNLQGSKVTETTWWKFSFWKKKAESANEYFKKGKKMLLEGSIQYDEDTHGPKTFEDKNTKAKRSSFEVSGTAFAFLGDSGGGGVHEQGQMPDEEESVPEKEEVKQDPKKAVEIPF